MLTFEMVTLAFPVFVMVIGRLLLLPMVVFPKVRLDGLAVSVVVIAPAGDTPKVTGMDKGELVTPEALIRTWPL